MIAEINGMSPQSIWTILRGGKLNSHVYAGETRIATQQVLPGDPPTQIINWDQIDPLTGTRTSLASYNGYSVLSWRSEPDLQGIEVGNVDPATLPPPPPDPEIPDYFGWGGTGWNPNQPEYSYNGIRISEQFAMELLSSPSGAAVLDPKFKHDSMTLSRAGIFGYYVQNQGTQGFDVRPDGKGGYTMGIGVEAGGSLFVVSGIRSDARPTEFISIISGDMVGTSQTTTTTPTNLKGRILTSDRRILEVICRRRIFGFEWSKEVIGIAHDVTTATIVSTTRPIPRRELKASDQPPMGEPASDDQRGHIIGDALGGGPESRNLFWQNRLTNTSTFARIENQIRELLTAYPSAFIQLKVQLNYEPPSCNSPNDPQRFFRPIGGVYSFRVSGDRGAEPYSPWISIPFDNPR